MTDTSKPGRPSIYSEAVADRICERLMDGVSLRTICEADDMPCKSTVLRWLQSNQDFRQRYILAREMQAENIADEILEIADDARNDWMERHGGDDEGYQPNTEHIQRSRLRIDARKWMASKLAPKRYGDKIQQEVSGPDGGAVQVTTIERIIVRPGDIPR